MTQHTFTSFNPAQRDGSDLEAIMNALHSTHQGSSRPSYAQQGMLWVDKLNNPSRGRLYMFDGSHDIELGTFDFDANTFSLADSALAHLGTAAALNVGTAANQVVQLNGGGKLPALDGSLLTNLDLSSASFPLPDAQKVARISGNKAGGGAYRMGGVIMADRTLRAWGNNSYSQLGQGSWQANTREAPVMVSFPNSIASEPVKWVSSGYNHWVIFENGDMHTWGRNNFGELGRNNTTQLPYPTKVTSGDIDTKNVVDIQVGYSQYNNACHALALTDNGDLYTCGHNAYGQCGTGDTTQVNAFTQIGIGQTWAKIYAFGSTYGFSAAITTGGDLYTWGHNAHGQLGLGDIASRTVPTLNNFFGGVNVDHIAGSMDNGTSSGTQWQGFMLARLTNGKVYSWGYNGFGQLGTGNTTQYDVPQEITALGTDNEEVIAVGGDQGSSYVRKTGNVVYSSGYNGRGALGRSATTDQNTFGEVVGSNYSTIEQVIAIGGQSYQSLFIRYDDGRVKCCGYNGNGQLGVGTNADRTNALTYVRLHERLNAVDLCAIGLGSEAALGILTDTGQYLQTGYGGNGQNGDEDEQSTGVPRLFSF